MNEYTADMSEARESMESSTTQHHDGFPQGMLANPIRTRLI